MTTRNSTLQGPSPQWHPKPKSGDQEVWPIQMTLRGSEGAQKVKDAWLSSSFSTVLGKDYDLGRKVSRYLPGMATRLVMKDLGEEPEIRARARGSWEGAAAVRNGRRMGSCRTLVGSGAEYKESFPDNRQPASVQQKTEGACFSVSVLVT